MKKKKLVEIKVSVILDKAPTTLELEALRKVFPGVPISILSRWERDSQV